MFTYQNVFSTHDCRFSWTLDLLALLVTRLLITYYIFTNFFVHFFIYYFQFLFRFSFYHTPLDSMLFCYYC